MRGVVEVWRGDELLLEEPNMLVDGAGELLADVMTVSQSLSGVEDHATSSILDASNYRIQAISFGTGSYYFNNGARRRDTDKDGQVTYHATFFADLPAGITGSIGIIPFIYYPDIVGFTSYEPDFKNTVDGSSLRIDPATFDQLPTAPNPASRVLEENTNSSSLVPLAGQDDVALSSVFPGNGQHCNFLPSAIMSGMMQDTVFSGGVESYYYAASLLGAFPEGSSTPYTNTLFTPQVRVRYNGPVGGDDSRVTDGIASVFNEASSMDVSGFVTNVMSSVPNSSYSMSSTSSGLCLSAEPPDNDYEGFPFVEYSLLMGAGDLGHVNFYGGIYHIGLWSLDMKASLQNGNAPPFAFSVLNNPRKYKLFCRKTLSKNLCFITDDDQYSDLTLKWRIYFR
jgi:hypothetical protein